MPQLTDQQQKAVESIDCNVLVSAGAGAGKTMVLVERFLEVLKSAPEAAITDIIAVTFTRKAAEEMRTRLKARLREMSATALNSEEKKRWTKLLADVDRAKIGTIHSLCESILRAYPMEAGVDPQFELLDELTRAQMLNEATEEALQKLIVEPSGDQLVLLEYPIESIRKHVEQQLKSIPQYKDSRKLFGFNFEQMQGCAFRIVQAMQVQALSEIANDAHLGRQLLYLEQNPFEDADSPVELTRAQLLTAFRVAIAAGSSKEATSLNAAIQALAAAAQLDSLRTKGGPKAKPLRDVIREVQSIAKKFTESTPTELNEEDGRAFSVLRALLTIIDETIDRYERAKELAQKVDYNDLISKTYNLVCQDNSAARKSFSERTRAILVDEFQDTNHVQAKLLSSLCGSAARLFLIGDDKQSIYKFQGADVSTFNSWKALISEQTHGLEGKGLLLDLSYSFRSHPSIVDFVNRFFHFYFSEVSESGSHRAAHQALTPSREDAHEASRVEVVLYEPPIDETTNKPIEIRATESAAIAAWISEKIGAGTTIFDKHANKERPLSFGDFAILVQANSDFGVIESALSEANIPYVTFAGAGFLVRQEIFDIENMLTWLACPEDDLALLAVLRSPFFALNDGLIHRITMSGEKYVSLWSRLKKCAKEEDLVVSIGWATDKLQHLLDSAPHLRLSDLVHKIVRETSYDTIVLSLPNGKQKSRNVWKFSSFIQQYDHQALPEFLAALAAMRELGVNNQTDAPLSSENAVKLMTIHKSKGLEFPAVILPAMSRKIHMVGSKLLVHRDFGIAFDTSRGPEDLKPSYFVAAQGLNSKMEEEEKKRLLYVAMTRARDYLAMFMERHTSSHGSFRTWVKQALALDEADETTIRAHLAQNEHYTVRAVDFNNIKDWQAKHNGLDARAVQRSELEALAKETGFALIPQACEQAATEAQKRKLHWQKQLRVTAGKQPDKLEATVVGHLFHAAMQQVALRPAEKLSDQDLHNLASSGEVSIVDVQIRSKTVERVSGFLSKMYESPLWLQLSNALRVLPEVSYTTVDNGSTGVDKRPDLVLQDSSGDWHIVDFKTDRVEASDVEAKVNEHSDQVLRYARDFKELTELTAQGWLYFAEIGKLLPVKTPSFSVSKTGQLKLPLSG